MKKVLIFFFIIIYSCNNSNKIVIEKDELLDKLEGFWLGQSIANWTGLVTEMNKIGFTKDGTQEPFYTRDNWGKICLLYTSPSPRD